MFAIEYFESADPVFDALQKQRSALLERPYAGYLLFLFGNAHEDIATWFARNIVALDSLTGSSLAGLIFAERVRLRVQRTLKEASPGTPPSLEASFARSGTVSTDRITKVNKVSPPFDSRKLSDADFQAYRLVSRDNFEVRFPEQDISAITYGSDELAKRFGVFEDVPCIVLLDSVPSGTVEIIQLRNSDPEEVMHLLRRLIAQFTGREKYKDFFNFMSSVRSLTREINANIQVIATLQDRHAAVDSIEFPELYELNATNAFLRGKYKKVRKILWEDAPLTEQQRTPLLHDLKHCKLERRANGGILSSEAEANFLSLFPNLEIQQERLLQLRRERKLSIEREIEACRDNIGQIETKRDLLLTTIRDLEVPSLQTAFRKIMTGSVITSRRHQVGDAIFSWIGGFLKPDVLMKLGGLLDKH